MCFSTDSSMDRPGALSLPPARARRACWSCRASQSSTNSGSNSLHRDATSMGDACPAASALNSRLMAALISRRSAASMAARGALPAIRTASPQRPPGRRRSSHAMTSVSAGGSKSIRWQRLITVAGNRPVRSAARRCDPGQRSPAPRGRLRSGSPAGGELTAARHGAMPITGYW